MIGSDFATLGGEVYLDALPPVVKLELLLMFITLAWYRNSN